jgi:hypothetical protein
MTYLLSFLVGESSFLEAFYSEKESTSLCYYFNNTNHTQSIQMIAEHKCVFEKLVFSGERILFDAPQGEYLKVNEFLLVGVKTTEFECQWIPVAEYHGSKIVSGSYLALGE